MYRLYEDGTLISAKDYHGAKPKGGKELGKRTKFFRMTPKKRRLIRSSAIRLKLLSKKPVLFCTLTLPTNIGAKSANRAVSNFLDNLKTNYKLKNYVGTRELTKNGRSHYHFIMDIPFTSFKTLNKAWNAALSPYCPFSPNAFTTGEHPYVHDVHKVARYISKYITKIEGDANNPALISDRCYFISRGCLSAPADIEYNTMMYLITKYDNSVKHYDNFSVYYLKNFVCLPEYINLQPAKKRAKPPNRYRPKHTDISDLQSNFAGLFPATFVPSYVN